MTVLPDKLNVSNIFKNHWSTFGNVNGNGKLHDWFSFYILPLILSVAYWMLLAIDGWQPIPLEGWSSVITVTSILIPLMLAMLASLIGIDKNDNDRFHRLVVELIYNSTYGILISVILLVVALIAVVLGEDKICQTSPIFVLLTSHLFLTLVMIIKRFYRVAIRVKCE